MNKKLKLQMKIINFFKYILHNEKRIYKIDIKNGEITWIVCCIALFISIGIEVIHNKIKNLNIESLTILSRGIFISLGLIILFKISRYLLKFMFQELKTISEIDKNIKKFIKSNKLAEITTTKNGFKKVTYCPIITFQLFKDKLIIKFRLDGTPKSNNYCKLKAQLQGIMKMKCTLVDSDISWCKYEFRRGKIDQLNLVKDIIENNNYHESKDTIIINQNLKWNFRKAPHALISGITGSGKTYFLAYLIRMFLSFNANVCIIDPKRSDLSFLKKYLGKNVAYENSDIAEVLKKKVYEMEKRFDEFKTLPDYSFGKDYYDYGYNPNVIIIDELMSFMGGSAEAEDKKKVLNCMTDIVAKGRQAGFFIILSSQRSDTKFIDGPLRDQLSMRVSLGKMSSDGYKMVFGSGQNLKLTHKDKGAGYIFIDGKTDFPIEFNAPYLNTSYDFIKDIEKLINSKKNNSKNQEKDPLLSKINLEKKSLNNESPIVSGDISFDLGDIPK